MKAIVLLAFVICVLASFVLAQQANAVTQNPTAQEEKVGEEFRTEECKEEREIACQYLKRCAKVDTKTLECSEWKAAKYCWTINPSPNQVVGPTTCPAKQELTFSLDEAKKVITRSCRSASTVDKQVCHSVLDPHNKDIKDRHFEFQHEGDFVFIKTKDGVFECHQRLSRFTGAAWSGTTAFACRVNGNDVVQWNQGQILVNGRQTTITSGKYNLPQAGYIEVATNQAGQQTIRVASPNRAELYFVITYSYYNPKTRETTTSGNLYGYIPKDLQVEGVCAGNEDFWSKTHAVGIFNFNYINKYLGEAYVQPTYTAAQRTAAEATCLKLIPRDVQPRFNNCVFDVLLAGNAGTDATKLAQAEAQVPTDEKAGNPTNRG